MQRGGRPKNPIWGHFHCLENGTKVTVQCKLCLKVQSAKPDRMRDHYAKCLKQKSTESSDQNVVPASPAVSEPVKRSADASNTVPPMKKRQSDMNQHVLRTTDTQKDQLDEEVAELVYACNLPFSLVEHPLFKKLVDSLRPGYKPPTREMLSTKLLDKVHSKLQSQMKAELNNKTVTMQQDGWSTVQNDPVIATCISVEGKAYFVDAKDTGTTHKTAEACLEMLKDSRSAAENAYGCKVKSFVTDHARNMEKMRKALEEEDDTVVTYGCLAHGLNLLGQDLTPAPIMKHVVEIHKFFRNHHVPSSWLKQQLGAKRPQLPNETRWKGQLMCLDTYLSNRTYYIRFIEEYSTEMEPALVRKVMDMNLYNQVRDLADMLRPVAIALDRAQNDKTTIADACEIFFRLLNEPTLQDNKQKVQKRFDMVINPCHLAAYIFHPKYLGEGLTPEQKELATEWIINKDDGFLPPVISFQAKAHPFPQMYFQPAARLMSPVTWWKAMAAQCGDLPSGFADLMIALQTACASSASLERIFSTFGLVMTKLRNRLGLAKAQKLVFVYRMLRGPQELDY